jgi:excinuclease ABC subunit C
MSQEEPTIESSGPGDKVRQFPTKPGVYLMKDRQGRVLYVGKAKNLRNRTGHYFSKAAREDPRTADLIKLIADVDYVEAESEVDALLLEARLVKDIQPRFNVELKDDKSFPYLQIRMREDFPRVEFTRTPRRRGVKLYGPFTSAKGLRAAIQVLQRIFQFRTCSLDIKAEDPRWRWFRPCILHNIHQCTAPCNFRVTKEAYRKQIRGLRLVLEGKKDKLLAEMEQEMTQASADKLYEKAARLRDEIKALKNLGLRGDVDKNVQPEVFQI